MTDLNELQARVESAEGADREIDAEIAWVALEEDWSSGDEKATNEPFPHIKRLPPYTASLDAALGLVERVLPGWDYWLERDEHAHKAAIWRAGTYIGGHGVESAPTPALAILAALLKALIAQDVKEGADHG